MPGIQNFIQLATQNLGVSEDTAKSATGGLLDFVQQKVPASDFQNLMGELPGASNLLGAASSGSGGAGGLLGNVAKMAGSVLGGKLGTAAGIVAALQGSGLDIGQVGGFLTQFLSFAKQNVSGDLMGRVLDAVPELKSAASS